DGSRNIRLQLKVALENVKAARSHGGIIAQPLRVRRNDAPAGAARARGSLNSALGLRIGHWCAHQSRLRATRGVDRASLGVSGRVAPKHDTRLGREFSRARIWHAKSASNKLLRHGFSDRLRSSHTVELLSRGIEVKAHSPFAYPKDNTCFPRRLA